MSSRRSRTRRSSAELDRSSSEVPGDDSVPDRSASADRGEHDASRSGDGDSGRDGDAGRDGDGDRGSTQRSDVDRDTVKAAILEVLADPEVIRQMVAAVSGVSGCSTSTSVVSDGE